MSYCFKPIGVVEKGLPEPEDSKKDRHESRYEIISSIRIFDELKPTSRDAMRMNTVNREPVIRPKDPLVL